MDNRKQIHIYFINKIKDLDYKIFEYEDKGFVNRRAIANCEHHIERWLDKANVLDKDLRRELLENITWSDDYCAQKLVSLGWLILTGKTVLNLEKTND